MFVKYATLIESVTPHNLPNCAIPIPKIMNCDGFDFWGIISLPKSGHFWFQSPDQTIRWTCLQKPAYQIFDPYIHNCIYCKFVLQICKKMDGYVFIYHVSLTFLVLLFWTFLTYFFRPAFMDYKSSTKMSRKWLEKLKRHDK